MAENKIKVKGLTTFYREEGTGDPILILHGWGSNANTWRKTQKELARLGYRSIAIDLPGFWRTEEPPEPWYLKDYTEFIDEFVQKLDLYGFTLMGHSFGGRIAIDYATRYPKKLHALVLVAAAGIIRHKKAKLKLLLVLTKIGNMIFTVPPLYWFKPIAQKMWYRFTGEHDYEKATPVMKTVMQRVLNEELYERLPHITTPTLILWGDQDTTTPLTDGFVIHKMVPVSHLHVFPGEPHGLQIKAPIRVARQTARFLGARPK
ncbi:MAG: alpha/beta hydrolase [Candidatus Spechtbacterales bacterium]|nr:alpha/beta hydrolase [Candidatus Spechtbacterales bacterium]